MICFDFAKIKLITYFPTHHRTVNTGILNTTSQTANRSANCLHSCHRRDPAGCPLLHIKWDLVVLKVGSFLLWHFCSKPTYNAHQFLVLWIYSRINLYLYILGYPNTRMTCVSSITSERARCSEGIPGFCWVLPLATGPCCSNRQKHISVFVTLNNPNNLMLI